MLPPFAAGLQASARRRAIHKRSLFVESIEDRVLLTAYSSVKSGLWSDPTVWGKTAGSGLFPQAGDTATIKAGQAVTVNTNITVGNSPAAGSYVLSVLGELLINAQTTMTVRGDVLQSGTTGFNGQIICAGNLQMDGTASGLKYKVQDGAQSNTNAKLVFAGTTDQLASFSSLGTGSTNSYVTGAYAGAGRIEANYCNFTNIGDATNPAANSWLANNLANALIIRHSTFTGCGTLQTKGAIPASCTFEISDTTWSNTRGAKSLSTGTYDATVAGSRLILNNRFDKLVSLSKVNDLVVDSNYFGAGYSIGGTNPAKFQNNLVNVTNVGGLHAMQTMVNNYIFDDTSNNPHPLIMSVAADVIITGHIFDSPIGEVGDLIVGGPNSGSYTLTATRNIVLPNSGGRSPAVLISPTGSGFRYTVNNNTMISTTARTTGAVEPGIASYGETYHGMPGMYDSIKSNLVATATNNGMFLNRHNTSDVSDPLVSPSAADYNGASAPVKSIRPGVYAVFGPKGGYVDSMKTVIKPMFTSTDCLGAHDIVAPPNFVDATRNLATFDSAYLKNTAPEWVVGKTYQVGEIVSASSPGFFGGAVVNFVCVAANTAEAASATIGKPGVATGWRGTWQLASLLRILNSSATYTPGTPQATPRDLYEWVKTGAAPTNTAYKSTGFDGGDIGAVPVASAPTPTNQTIDLAQDDSARIVLSATDQNQGALPLSFSILTGPTHGRLSGNGTEFVYVPDPGYVGSDTIQFKVTNSLPLSSTGTIRLDVVARPTADNLSLAVDQGSSIVLNLTGSDLNSVPRTLSYLVTTSPAHGTLSGAAPSFVYTPDPTYSGSDCFTFVASNGTAISAPATVSLDVIPETAPVLTDLLAQVGETWISVMNTSRTLPWTEINAIRAVFSKPVLVSASDLVLTDSNGETHESSGFEIEPLANMATWQLPTALGVDLLTLSFDGHSSSAIRTALGTYLNRGTDSSFLWQVLPGDTNDDGTVDQSDADRIQNCLDGLCTPSIFDDLNGDGLVSILDYDLILERLGTTLPSR